MQAPSFDRGRIPTGCATMSGSLLTGPPREVDQGGRKGGEMGTGMKISLYMNYTL